MIAPEEDVISARLAGCAVATIDLVVPANAGTEDVPPGFTTVSGVSPIPWSPDRYVGVLFIDCASFIENETDHGPAAWALTALGVVHLDDPRFERRSLVRDDLTNNEALRTFLAAESQPTVPTFEPARVTHDGGTVGFTMRVDGGGGHMDALQEVPQAASYEDVIQTRSFILPGEPPRMLYVDVKGTEAFVDQPFIYPDGRTAEVAASGDVWLASALAPAERMDSVFGRLSSEASIDLRIRPIPWLQDEGEANADTATILDVGWAA